MNDAPHRQSIPLRVLAAWPALTPVVMFAIAELVQLIQHGVSGFHRATVLNGLDQRKLNPVKSSLVRLSRKQDV